jgi:hypothetical protein
MVAIQVAAVVADKQALNLPFACRDPWTPLC